MDKRRRAARPRHWQTARRMSVSSGHSPSTGCRPDSMTRRTFLRGAHIERLPGVKTLGAAGVVRRRRTIRRAVAGVLAALVDLEHARAGSLPPRCGSLVACAASLQRLLGRRGGILGRLVLLFCSRRACPWRLHLGVEIAEAVVPPEPELMQEAGLDAGGGWAGSELRRRRSRRWLHRSRRLQALGCLRRRQRADGHDRQSPPRASATCRRAKSIAILPGPDHGANHRRRISTGRNLPRRVSPPNKVKIRASRGQRHGAGRLAFESRLSRHRDQTNQAKPANSTTAMTASKSWNSLRKVGSLFQRAPSTEPI